MDDRVTPFAIVPIEVALDDRLTRSQLRVLIALLSWRGRVAEPVWPTREQISQRCGLNPVHVSRATGELEDLGWVVKTDRRHEGLGPEYRLTVPLQVAEGGTTGGTPPGTTGGTPPYIEKKKDTAKGSASQDKAKKLAMSEQEVLEAFDRFWQAYPKKTAKPAALQAFRKNLPAAAGPVVLAALALQRQSTSWRSSNGQYIPHPATWLNHRRWEDEQSCSIDDDDASQGAI